MNTGSWYFPSGALSLRRDVLTLKILRATGLDIMVFSSITLTRDKDIKINRMIHAKVPIVVFEGIFISVTT